MFLSIKNLLLIAVIMSLTVLRATAQKREAPAEKFIRLLNQCDRDGLNLLITDDFTLTEKYANHSWSRQGFLDSFVLQSKAINGVFRIIQTRKIPGNSTIIMVEDQ